MVDIREPQLLHDIKQAVKVARGAGVSDDAIKMAVTEGMGKLKGQEPFESYRHQEALKPGEKSPTPTR